MNESFEPRVVLRVHVYARIRACCNARIKELEAMIHLTRHQLIQICLLPKASRLLKLLHVVPTPPYSLPFQFPLPLSSAVARLNARQGWDLYARTRYAGQRRVHAVMGMGWARAQPRTTTVCTGPRGEHCGSCQGGVTIIDR